MLEKDLLRKLVTDLLVLQRVAGYWNGYSPVLTKLYSQPLYSLNGV